MSCPVGILLFFVQCSLKNWNGFVLYDWGVKVFSSRDHEWQSSFAADELRVWDRPPPSSVRAARRFSSRWRVQRCHVRGGGEALSCTQSHSSGPLPVFQVIIREMLHVYWGVSWVKSLIIGTESIRCHSKAGSFYETYAFSIFLAIFLCSFKHSEK